MIPSDLIVMIDEALFRFWCWQAMRMPVEVVLAGEDGVIDP